MKIIWARKSLATATVVGFALVLAGCSGLNLGTLPGSTPGAAGAANTGAHNAGSKNAAGCTANATSIPNGHYTGKIDTTIDLVMTITADGISLPSAGGGKERWQGTVNLTSKGGQVTGVISLSELGLSQVGQPGSVQVHSVDNGTLYGDISGPASKPAVAAIGTGEWASLDSPVVNSSGGATERLTGGLHITKAACGSISGDDVAMFSDFMAPVAQYLKVSGDGTWVATRN
jgi:hypothetical protein